MAGWATFFKVAAAQPWVFWGVMLWIWTGFFPGGVAWAQTCRCSYVVSHRGQEFFKVAPMGYCNSPPYVQRQMDNLLRMFREFCRIYIDDMITASRTLEQHVDHLEQVFTKLEEHNISLSPTKAFIGFPSVTLLGRHVNSLGFSTPADRAAAIVDIPFPKKLHELEKWIGLTGCFRNHVPGYADQSTESCQDAGIDVESDQQSVLTASNKINERKQKKQRGGQSHRHRRNPQYHLHFADELYTAIRNRKLAGRPEQHAIRWCAIASVLHIRESARRSPRPLPLEASKNSGNEKRLSVAQQTHNSAVQT